MVVRIKIRLALDSGKSFIHERAPDLAKQPARHYRPPAQYQFFASINKKELQNIIFAKIANYICYILII